MLYNGHATDSILAIFSDTLALSSKGFPVIRSLSEGDKFHGISQLLYNMFELYLKKGRSLRLMIFVTGVWKGFFKR